MDKAIQYTSIVAVVAVLFAGGAWAYFSLRTPAPSAPAQNTAPGPDIFGGSPTANTGGGTVGQSGSPQPPSSKVEIRNRDGAAISVNAFLPDENATSTKSVDATGPSSVVPLYWHAEGLFSLTFNTSNDYFVVSLIKEPIGAARLAAETYVVQLLGITQDDACRLNYSIIVLENVNPVYAGKNLGFSFCPGALSL